MHNFSENFETRIVGAPVSAGSSIDNNSDRIDMRNYESVTFIQPITDSADTGVAALTVEENETDEDSGMTAVSGAADTLTSAADDDLNSLGLQVEVRNPTQRFVQAVRSSSVANIAYGPMIAVLKPRRVPVTPHTSIPGPTLTTL